MKREKGSLLKQGLGIKQDRIKTEVLMFTCVSLINDFFNLNLWQFSYRMCK